MAERLLRLPEVMSRTGLGRTSVYDLQSQGLLPLAISLGGRSRAWVESEIEAWIRERIDESRKAA